MLSNSILTDISARFFAEDGFSVTRLEVWPRSLCPRRRRVFIQTCSTALNQPVLCRKRMCSLDDSKMDRDIHKHEANGMRETALRPSFSLFPFLFPLSFSLFFPFPYFPFPSSGCRILVLRKNNTTSHRINRIPHVRRSRPVPKRPVRLRSSVKYSCETFFSSKDVESR